MKPLPLVRREQPEGGGDLRHAGDDRPAATTIIAISAYAKVDSSADSANSTPTAEAMMSSSCLAATL